MRLILVLLLLAGFAFKARAETANPVVEWNELLLSTAQAEDGFLTLKGVRAAAIMHLAIHDSLNAIEDEFNTYAYHDRAPLADPGAALAHAAYDVAADQYPDKAADFAALRDRWLAKVDDSRAKSAGAAVGAAAARAALAKRVGDNWNTEVEYQLHPMGPGVYAEFPDHSGTPQGFVFGAAWAHAKGFALKSADQFRAPPPPAIDSDAYARAFNEVKEVGRFQSMTRTADQTHLALWWKDFAENSHNRLARKLAVEEKLSLAESARLFALINMGIFDAYVSVFENKFHYNHWRPYTAIRWAENDGNPDTAPEPTWNNTHRHTYAFPSYPSAHGAVCAAAMAVFSDVFGDARKFEMETKTVDIAGPFSEPLEMHPPTRRFKRFSNAAEECALSRVYLGIHFRYDSVEGTKLGRAVGENVIDTLLTRR
ncbi:MAG: haloperoxidase [Hyphococcus sp.]|nr:MAG: haloperoxidase [Marinicaulis sp.]